MHTDQARVVIEVLKWRFGPGAPLVSLLFARQLRIYMGEGLACLSHRSEATDFGEVAANVLAEVRGTSPTFPLLGGWAPEDWVESLFAYAVEDLEIIANLNFPDPGGGCFGLVIGHDHLAGELLRIAGQYQRAVPY